MQNPNDSKTSIAIGVCLFVLAVAILMVLTATRGMNSPMPY
jgi:hypothetical protein